MKIKKIKGNLILKEDFKFDGDLIVEGDIKCEGGIWNINCHNIDCNDINCKNIYCNDINCNNLDCWNIYCHNINCHYIKCWDIDCFDIRCNTLDCWNIYCWEIRCNNLDCNNLSFYTSCVAYNSLKCKSAKGRRKNFILKCLDKEIDYKGNDNNLNKQEEKNVNCDKCNKQIFEGGLFLCWGCSK